MARKVKRAARIAKPKIVGYEHYLIPSVIGGVIAWFFSESMMLGVVVFVAVLVGNYFGFKILTNK